ncbi:ectonucleoside triphosphate diphosphohydrolase 8-like [Saccoglossus kowalevskii]|uniref:Ectonucleoside triphosphate diphosphohydrolase 8-like n=1 Tax=Saccoglossus kowalevskii TaxID=10224 RepID=A0ABM0M6C0_SACKO|nr:PREDICTED: ectonucleoside triphosphate diphosphohydrolase 8-like [Saccoglossus kowalevskii]
MIITVHAVIDGHTSRVPVEIEPHDSIESLVYAFCYQQGAPAHRTYVVRNEKEDILDFSKSLALCGIEDSDTVYITEGDEPVEYLPSPQMPLTYNPFLILGIVLTTVGIVGIVIVAVVQNTAHPEIQKGYGLSWDAGSTHSKLHVYHWPVEKEDTTALVTQIDQCRADGGGLSSYLDNPQDAGKSLEPCIEKTAMSAVPKDEYSQTPIMLGATAGMRLLEKEDKNVSDAIISSVWTSLEQYPFNVTNVSIISGESEGSFSWVTVNYLLGNFVEVPASLSSIFWTSTEKHTVGAIDMGGASTQMTFIPEDTTVVPIEDQRYLKLYGEDYHVYTHSYLCYGVREAERRFLANLVKDSNYTHTVINPCAPIGYSEHRTAAYLFDAYCSHGDEALSAWGSEVVMPNDLNIDLSNITFTINGSSNTTQCSAEVRKLFDTPPFQSVFKPPVFGEYYAFSTFYYTTNNLNISTNASMAEFNNTMLAFCNLTWDEVKVMPSTDRSLLPAFCFQAQFIFGFLVDGYKFTPETWKFQFRNSVSGSDLGWSLGFMINATNLIPSEQSKSATLSTGVFIALMVIFGIILCVGIAFMFYAWVKKQRPSPLATSHKYGAI